MKWQELISTPLFWIVSAIGTIVLSIVANLLTPRVAAIITRRLSDRRSGVRQKQIRRRDQVITLQCNPHQRTSLKLDAVLKLLLATVLLLLSTLLFQLVVLNPHISNSLPLMPLVTVPVLFVIFGSLVFALAAIKLGLDDMSLALIADKREQASDRFLRKHGSVTTDEMTNFEDDWDLKQFGVNSNDDKLARPSESI